MSKYLTNLLKYIKILVKGMNNNMFLTKECDYAIRVVRSLIDFEKKTVRAICEYEHIPFSFAYKILKKLEHAGIVLSHRGALGGYQLAKKPEEITLYKIVSVIEENLFLNECLQEGHTCPHNSQGNYCGVHKELERIQGLLISALNEKTIDRVFNTKNLD